MKIAIGNDHAAGALKAVIVDYLKELGHEVTDLGANDGEMCDYPEYGERVAKLL